MSNGANGKFNCNGALLVKFVLLFNVPLTGAMVDVVVLDGSAVGGAGPAGDV